MNNLILYGALILFGGIALGRLVKQIKMPNVTGYLIAGLLIGPFVLKILPFDLVEKAEVLSEIALGFIAFTIGGEFKISYLKKVGTMPIVITLFEALTAVFLVTGGLLIFGFPISFALCMGAIASATAPAATIMVVRQYKAKGPVTNTLLTVVAMDDAVALMAFGLAAGAARVFMHVEADTGLLIGILRPAGEILLSVALGLILGALFTFPLRWFKKDGNRTILILALILLGCGLANWLHLSELLLCMAMGSALINLTSEAKPVFRITENLTPPLFLIFFVISGAEMDISVLPTIGLAGLVYVLLRVGGKMAGAAIGAKIAKAPATVQKYLGMTLIPQAGVAIGLSLVATDIVPEYAATIRAIVLCATILYEVAGPIATKIALRKAGEIEST